MFNWHVAREVGVSLVGPSPRDLIAATTQADFVSAIRMYMRWLLAKAEALDTPELQAYAIVTACRALHTCITGQQTSKEAAARWAEDRYPEWSESIRAARERGRTSPSQRPAANVPISRGLEFVRFAVQEVSPDSELIFCGRRLGS